MEIKSAKPLPKILTGSVCQQWKRCGKQNCHCASGRPHGPYHYRYFWENGRQRKLYVRRGDVEQVRQACDSYRNEMRQRRKERELARQNLRILRDSLADVRALIARMHGE